MKRNVRNICLQSTLRQRVRTLFLLLLVVVTHDLAIADAANQVYRMTDGVLTASSA